MLTKAEITKLDPTATYYVYVDSKIQQEVNRVADDLNELLEGLEQKPTFIVSNKKLERV